MGKAELTLVSCVGMKRDGLSAARELYTSPWFKKARRYVEQRGRDWFILSAKHGLVSPWTLIDPYEQTLNRMGVADRRAWADAVLAGLRRHVGETKRVEILAGQRYREFLTEPLEKMGIEVVVPMEGLKIGEQLSWLDAHALSGRAADVARFYACLEVLEARTCGKRLLHEGRGPIPRTARGVYFFFEPGQDRCDSGAGPRVVRVGTHGLKANAKSTLWSRLAQHRGKAKELGGNHRGSIFRLLAGNALIQRDELDIPTWGRGNSAKKPVVKRERELEAQVSATLHAMPYLWLELDDEPGPESLRGVVERNTIALLSNYEKDAVDAPSLEWLGLSCGRKRVRRSGLWNQNHVDEDYDPGFLDMLEDLVR